MDFLEEVRLALKEDKQIFNLLSNPLDVRMPRFLSKDILRKKQRHLIVIPVIRDLIILKKDLSITTGKTI